ncbi:MAG: hypothetical protein IKN63_01230 [Bacilli bacterium]|nr:hypothetical protein [Bacilli bacterium]
MEKIEELEKLKKLTENEISLTEVAKILEKNSYQILGLLHELRLQGINIVIQRRDDDIYMYNHGERELENNNKFNFYTNEFNEFKFVVIADTRIGSKHQQLSILNDIYQKAYDMGYMNVFLVGNISEGLYPLTNVYSEDNFLDDTLEQVDYIVQNYPLVEGMKTYFITGLKDEKHLRNNKINLGKRISDARCDMIYLGHNSCNVLIDKVNVLLISTPLSKTYTVSYRPEQQINSFRSEDKPNIMLFGGALQLEKFTYRNVACLSIPSVCATTREMNDKRYSNTIGAWYVSLKTDKYGNLLSLNAMDSVYYRTNPDDYIKRKVLKIGGINNGK